MITRRWIISLGSLVAAVFLGGIAPAAPGVDQCRPASPYAQSKCARDAQCCQGLVCQDRHCQPGCRIDGAFYAGGAPNPANTCQTCQPGVSTTTFTTKADGSKCNDGIFCNGADTCLAGLCSVHPGNPCPGPDGDGNCAESCNEAARTCTAPDPSGSACNDNNACTTGETCQADGSCGGGIAAADMSACSGGLCCRGICIAGGSCCADADCASGGGKTCVAGTCACPVNTLACGDQCVCGCGPGDSCSTCLAGGIGRVCPGGSTCEAKVCTTSQCTADLSGIQCGQSDGCCACAQTLEGGAGCFQRPGCGPGRCPRSDACADTSDCPAGTFCTTGVCAYKACLAPCQN